MTDQVNRSLQDWLPKPILSAARNSRDWLERIRQYPAAYLHPWRLRSIQKLRSYHNKYRGERCVVIGNGPSLRKMDLSPLQQEITFGMNRVYLAFEEWGFSTSFLVSVNELVIEQCKEDFHDLRMPKFFSWHSRDTLYPQGPPDPQTHFLFTTYTGPTFTEHAACRMWEGATVTYVCLQLAFFMGFETVILIGVDHHFESRGKANQMVISQGADRNHFLSNYFGKGFRWQLPDLKTSEAAYRMAREAFQQDDRKIIDATLDGQLTVFPKADFNSLLSNEG